jgi:hypothetical protein
MSDMSKHDNERDMSERTGGAGEPLSAERLAEIRALVSDEQHVWTTAELWNAAGATLGLLAERDRLAAALAAAMVIVRAVAAFSDFIDADGYFTQLQIEARALLASSAADDGEQA